MSIVRIEGIPKMGSAGDTAPAPFLTISIVPEMTPAKPPSVSSKSVTEIIRIGLVKFIGAISALAVSAKLRFAPHRWQ